MDKIEQFINENIQKSLLIKKTRSNIRKKHLLWYLIHCITFIYPLKPTKDEKLNYAEFFVLHLQNILSNCNSCKNNYNKHIQDTDLDKVFENRETLSNFFINMHNEISDLKSMNDNINYKKYAYEEIKEIYEKYNFLEYFKEKYELDIISIFKTKDFDIIIQKFDNF